MESSVASPSPPIAAKPSLHAPYKEVCSEHTNFFSCSRGNTDSIPFRFSPYTWTWEFFLKKWFINVRWDINTSWSIWTTYEKKAYKP
jgi:hypothetical protein